MRFIGNVIKDDLSREFSGLPMEFTENEDTLDVIFRNDRGCDLKLVFGERFTLEFEQWHGDYLLTDDEYERLLWDIRDIIHGSAFSVSVMVGKTLFISYLTRGELNSADDFINDDPIECAGLRKTGAVIECVYYDNSRNKRFVLEKE